MPGPNGEAPVCQFKSFRLFAWNLVGLLAIIIFVTLTVGVFVGILWISNRLRVSEHTEIDGQGLL